MRRWGGHEIIVDMAPRQSMQGIVSLVVCGKFHYFNYAPLLGESGVLREFIYSHRLSSSTRLGLGNQAVNLWPKEYLYQGHNRLLGNWGLDAAARVYHQIWQIQLVQACAPAPILHFMLHGNCLELVRKAKALGSYIIADAVNSFPDDYFDLIGEEERSLGLPGNGRSPSVIRRFHEEIALADSFLAPSTFVAKSFVRHGISRDRIRLIPFGANLRNFLPGPDFPRLVGRDVFKVVCVAQITARKGHQYLLRAWKRLALPRAELHCFGFQDNRIMRPLLGIGAPNVYFHGSVARTELVVAMQQADCFVLPTIEEGFAVAILEAMACGLPVVTTANSGAEDFLADGREGFVVPIRAVEELADRIEWIYENRSGAREMGLAGRRHLESGCTWQAYADELTKHYRVCLAQSGRSSPSSSECGVL